MKFAFIGANMAINLASLFIFIIIIFYDFFTEIRCFQPWGLELKSLPLCLSLMSLQSTLIHRTHTVLVRLSYF